MGQQQLLLVILVTVVIGIATVAAISLFGSAAEQANHDAVRQDLMQIAASAQAWYLKPDALGGGSNSFKGITFNSINSPGDIIDVGSSLEVTNLNGNYKIVPGTSDQFTVEGRPASNESSGDNVFVATVAPENVTISVKEQSEEPAPVRPRARLRLR